MKAAVDIHSGDGCRVVFAGCNQVLCMAHLTHDAEDHPRRAPTVVSAWWVGTHGKARSCLSASL